MKTENVPVCVGDNILITLPEVSEKTDGGIIKDEDTIAKELESMDSHITTVVSAGENVKLVKEGDKIMIRSAQVPIFTVNGVRYGGIKEYDIFCVITTKEVDETISA